MKKLFYIFAILPIILFAHPHTFLDVYTDVKSKNNQIESVTFKWVFDDMTSQLLIMEFDQNMDGDIDKEEVKFIKTNYFDSLEQYNYYTNLKIMNKIQTTKVKNFTSYIENMKIVYQFEIEINRDKKDVAIEIYDEERFTALVLKKEFVSSKIKYKVSDVDYDIYFGYRLEFE
ncbi:MAG: DUF1007 family protein [Campylobacterota bacterium]|nr:DUF1007 family protein [Campylobacterota bacterium]